MIRNIIWDVDGTLFDTYPAIARAFRLAVNDLGADAPQAWIMEAARNSLGFCVSALAERCHLTAEEIDQHFDHHYNQPRSIDPPFPGVIKICQHICSLGGKNLIVSHRGVKGVTQLLTDNQMLPYFSGWITRDDGYPKKPNPAAFEAILQMHRLLKEDTIAVGDREIDILAGQAAGLTSCLFTDAKVETAANLTITNFDELYAYLLAGRT